MKKAVFLVLMGVLVAPLFAFVVPSAELTSKYGISYAERQTGYVEKGGYSFRYLGNGTWDVKPLNNQSRSGETSWASSSEDSNIVILIVIVAIIHIILTFAMYKMKGGGYACFYFFLAPVALLGLLLFLGKGVGGYDPKKNRIDVTHHHR
jgi:hypothetical protein